MPAKPLPEVSIKELKSREALMSAVMYVAAFFIVAMIGYGIYLLVSEKVDSVEELTGRYGLSMGGFGIALVFSRYSLRKIRAELKIRQGRDIAK